MRRPAVISSHVRRLGSFRFVVFVWLVWRTRKLTRVYHALRQQIDELIYRRGRGGQWGRHRYAGDRKEQRVRLEWPLSDGRPVAIGRSVGRVKLAVESWTWKARRVNSEQYSSVRRGTMGTMIYVGNFIRTSRPLTRLYEAAAMCCVAVSETFIK